MIIAQNLLTILCFKHAQIVQSDLVFSFCFFFLLMYFLLTSGQKLLVGPQLFQGGSCEQRYPSYQRPWHPRGIPQRDALWGASAHHSGCAHRRAGHHWWGGHSVHGPSPGTPLKSQSLGLVQQIPNPVFHPAWQWRDVDVRANLLSVHPTYSINTPNHHYISMPHTDSHTATKKPRI